MFTTEETPFFSSLQQIFRAQESDSLKEKAWDHFLELGLPDKSSDAFKYVPLRKLYDLKLETAKSTSPSQAMIDSVAIPEAEGSTLVFANGRFSKELSCLPSKIVILPLQEALKIYGPFLQGRLHKNLKEETDPFAVLNIALQHEGIFCYLPPNLRVEKPLHLIFYGEGASSYHPSRLHIFCSSGSELKTVSTVVGDGVHHTAMDVAVEENAHFSHSAVSTKGRGIHFSDFKATLKRTSSLKHLSTTESKALTRNRLRVSLLGEGSSALLQGLWNLSGNHQCHTHVHVEHVAPSAHSLQKFKGVLRGQSQSSFEGKIYVHPEAQKTEAYQLNHNLLLDEGAVANAKPNLEIFADDVKASHGATMSQVDAEQLFYLQSRGVAKDVAKDLLVKGFIREILDQIPYESLRHDHSL